MVKFEFLFCGVLEDQQCISWDKFENTASFSRNYQASQDCMCDTEHMFDCPSQASRQDMNDVFDNLDFDRFMTRSGLKVSNWCRSKIWILFGQVV